MGAGARRVLWWLMSAYIVLVVMAAGYAVYQGNVIRVNSEFSGLPLMLLALPWSWWFRDVKLSLTQSAFNNAVVLMLAFAAINVVVLAVVRRLVGRR